MEPINFSRILKRAIEMSQDKAIIYLINTLDGVNGICFECLDELLASDNYNFCSITLEIFNEQCQACSLLCNNEKDHRMIN